MTTVTIKINLLKELISWAKFVQAKSDVILGELGAAYYESECDPDAHAEYDETKFALQEELPQIIELSEKALET